MRSFFPLACLLALPCLARPVDPPAPPPPLQPSRIDKALALWNVPGVAVVIVRDGKVAYLAGHGVREVGKPEPVTPDTVFALSSCSKAFTTTAMAQLVDAGQLDWDDPVHKHLPWFRLADPLADREVRLRDLVCHRTGLASHVLLSYRSPYSPEEAVRRAAFLPLDRPFRTTLQYQNTMFTAAGLAAARAADTTWPDLIRSRLLAPLGMKDTWLTLPEARKTGRLATAHRLDRAGDPVVMPYYAMPDPDPAVSVYSTARDLGTWLQFQLAGGLHQGKRLVSTHHLRETHTPQIPMRLAPEQAALFPWSTLHSYAMGWVVHDHRGVRLLAHGGSVDGFRTHIYLAPERGVGIAVLANLSETACTLALAQSLLDQQLGLPTFDWHGLHQRAQAAVQQKSRNARAAHQARRQHGTHPTREPAAHVGQYEHPAYGVMRISFVRGKLVWQWRGETAPLEHFHYDTYSLSAELPGEADVTFTRDAAGNIASLSVTGNLGVTFRKTTVRGTSP